MPSARDRGDDGVSRRADAATGAAAGPFQLHDTVRVARVADAARARVASRPAMGVPRVGDMGSIVALTRGTDGVPRYVVEAVDQDGAVVWTAEFDARELSLADGHIEPPGLWK